jgi:hypothetical protein
MTHLDYAAAMDGHTIPQADPIPGRDDLAPDYTDNVVRMQAFVKRHPHVSITSPRINGTSEFIAAWVEASPDPRQDGVVEKIGHECLGFLMGYLEGRFDGPGR